MKKNIALLLAITLFFTLVACSKPESNPSESTQPSDIIETGPATDPTDETSAQTDPTNSTDPTQVATQPTENTTQETTQEPTPIETQAPTQKPTQTPTQKPTQIATSIVVTPTENPTPGPTEEPSLAPTQAPTKTPEKPEKVRFTSEIRAQYHAGEVNGYSLWSKKDSDTYVTTQYCVDYQGYVVFEFSDSENAETNVMNNAFITREVVRENNNSNIIFRLRQASTGNVLYTATSNDGYEIIEFQYSATSIWNDGYVIIIHKDEAYDGVTYKLGILGANGKWVVPLSSNNPVLTTMKDEADIDNFRSMYYLGEDIFYFTANDNYYFYNITQNTATKVQSDIDDYNIRSILQCADEFIDGVSVAQYNWGGSFAKITSDGKITRIECDFHEDFHERIGSYYYDKKNDRIIRMGYTYHQDGFSLFDSKGKIIKTLKNVDLVAANGFNEDGIAQLLIQNKEGTQYYTLMDTSGNFLFDPIKTSGCSVIDADFDLIINPDYNKCLIMVVDKNGTILYQQKKVGDLSHKNGVIYDKGANEKERYIQIEK